MESKIQTAVKKFDEYFATSPDAGHSNSKFNAALAMFCNDYFNTNEYVKACTWRVSGDGAGYWFLIEKKDGTPKHIASYVDASKNDVLGEVLLRSANKHFK